MIKHPHASKNHSQTSTHFILPVMALQCILFFMPCVRPYEYLCASGPHLVHASKYPYEAAFILPTCYKYAITQVLCPTSKGLISSSNFKFIK